MRSLILSLLVFGLIAAVANTFPPQAPPLRTLLKAMPPQAPPLKAGCQCPPGTCPVGCPCGCQHTKPAQAPAVMGVSTTADIPAQYPQVPVAVIEDCTIVYRDPQDNRCWRYTRSDGSAWEYMPATVPFVSVPYVDPGVGGFGGFTAPNFMPMNTGNFRANFSRGGSC